MEHDSRLHQRSIAFICFSFLIHISLVGFFVYADSESGGGSDFKAAAAGGSQGQNGVEVQVAASESETAPAALPSAKAPRRIQVQLPKKPLAAPVDESDVEIRKALEMARQQSETVVTKEETNDAPESLSPEIADAPDVTPANELENAETTQAPAAVTDDDSAASPDAGGDSTGTSGNGINMGSGSGSGSTDGDGKGENPEGDGAETNLIVMNASERRPLPGNPLPIYPERDRYLRHQGTTVLIGRVGSDGVVSDVRIEKSSGSATLDQSSVTAFSKWRFEPGQETLVRKSFVFSLKGEEEVLPARLGRKYPSQN